jgi:hypothetical protein
VIKPCEGAKMILQTPKNILKGELWCEGYPIVNLGLTHKNKVHKGFFLNSPLDPNADNNGSYMMAML